MTGDELKAARQGCGLSREQLGQMLGVAAQVVGGWERLGSDHIAATRPREAAATRMAKQRLPVMMNFMQAAGVMCISTKNPDDLMPCPQDWLPILSEGDPLALTDEPAVAGDLVLLRDPSGELATVARVMTEQSGGKMMCFTRPYQVQELPPPDGYKTIEYVMHRLHDGVPDEVSWTQVVPPDLV